MNTEEAIEKINNALNENDIDGYAEKPEIIVIEINSKDKSQYMRCKIAGIICEQFEQNFILNNMKIIVNKESLNDEITDILCQPKISYAI